MTLKRWEPFEGLTPLREAMNQLMEESFIRPMRFGMLGGTFPVDVYETETEYVVEAMVPGVKPDDIKVTALGDTLTIRATIKTTEKPEEKLAGRYVRRERFEGEMERIIELPTEIDPEKVTAVSEHGVLTLHVPKAEVAKPKAITVHVKELVAH